MSNFDLSDSVDFARVTMSPVASLLSELTGRVVQEWEIVEATFNDVKIHVFSSKCPYNAALSEIRDSGGRRKVRYTFPYVDGQTTDDIGRKAYDYELDVLLHGNRYKEGLESLRKEFLKSTPGKLRHPILGELTCVIENFQMLHSAEARKAVAIKLSLTEHNFFVGDVIFKPRQDSTVKSALVACLDAVKAIDRVITKVEANILAVRSFKTLINNALADYKAAYTKNLQSINKAFNSGSSVDIPTLLPVNEGGISNSDGTSSQSNFLVAVSPNDPVANIPTTQDTGVISATVQVVNQTNTIRDSVNDIIATLRASLDGEGALEFYDQILDLQNGAIAMQDAVEKGIQSSRSLIVSYTTPRLMSIREVAFAVGLSVDRVPEIETLNPTLLSANFIASGTMLQVPTE